MNLMMTEDWIDVSVPLKIEYADGAPAKAILRPAELTSK